MGWKHGRTPSYLSDSEGEVEEPDSGGAQEIPVGRATAVPRLSRGRLCSNIELRPMYGLLAFLLSAYSAIQGVIHNTLAFGRV